MAINGTTGNDTVTFTQDGIDDIYDGLAGNDTLAADASVTANLTIDMVAGTLRGTGIGLDTFRNFENVTGGSGNDVITGDGNANILHGGAGNDTLNGGGGADMLYGDAGNDTLNGGAGNDSLYGDAGVDQLNGGSGDDYLDGGTDTVDNSLSGGLGNDTARVHTNAANAISVQSSITQLIATGRGGIDRVSTVETILFDNATVQVATSGNAILQATNDAVSLLADGFVGMSGGSTGADYGTGVLANDLDIDDRMSVTGIKTATGTIQAVAAGGTPTTLAGTYGSLTIDLNGRYSYSANTAKALGAGVVGTDTFTYTSTDGEATATANLVFTVTGLNDNPVPGIIATQTTDDNAGTLAQDLTAGATDPDTGDTLTVSAITATFTETGDDTPQTLPEEAYFVDANGNFTFDPTYFDDLNVGASATVTIGYTLSDGHGGTTPASFTFIVQGVNDAAVFGSQGSTTIGEDTASFTTQVSVTDVDNAVANFALDAGEDGIGAYGTFTIAADGTWSYVTNADAQTLNDGDAPIETFSIVSADGTPSTVSVTVIGSNDAATFGGDLFGNVAEDEPAQVSGQVLIDDVDSDERVFGVTFVSSVPVPTPTLLNGAQLAVPDAGPFTALGAYGSFTITETGAWTYAVDGRANALLDEDVTETFQIISADGTPQDIVITVNGVDDPTIFSESSATTTEDAVESVEGVITAADPDSPTDFVANTIVDAFGTFTIDATGAWTFQVNTDGAQVIPGGETDTLTFAVETTGGAIGSVTINIGGLDNPAEPGGDTGPDLFESGRDGANVLHLDTENTVSGQVIANDPDRGESIWRAATIQGLHGSLTIAADGTYTYTLNQADPEVNALQIGGLLNDTIIVTTFDGTEQEISVGINGANDLATFTGNTQSVSADADSVEGTIVTLDPDSATAPLTPTGTLVGDFGTLVLNGDGTYVYTLDPEATGPLSSLENPTDVFTFTSPDGTEGQVVITINGVDDAPTVGVIPPAEIDEDDSLYAQDLLEGSTDPDGDDSLFVTDVSIVISGSPDESLNGTFDADDLPAGFAFNGSTLTIDPNYFNTLSVLESAQVQVNYTVTDGTFPTATSYVIDVAGNNDAPVFTPQAIIRGTDQDSISFDLRTGFADPDYSHRDEFAVVENQYTIQYNGDSDHELSPDDYSFIDGVFVLNARAFADLAEGETEALTVRYGVVDAEGAETEGFRTIVLTGVDDLAVIGGDTLGEISEDGTPAEDGPPIDTVTGTLTAFDPDADAPHSFELRAADGTTVVPSLDGAYGTFTLSPTGSWTYTLDIEEAQTLKADAFETFTVFTDDGASTIVTIIVDGIDDALVISGDSATTNEDATAPVGGTLVVSDVDDATPITPQSNVATAHGTFSIDAAGVWSFAVNTASVQSLNVGQQVIDTLTVQAGTQTATLSVTITGSDDLSRNNGGSAVVTNDNAGLFTIDLAGGTIDPDDEKIVSNLTITLLDAQGNPTGEVLSVEDFTQTGTSFTLDTAAFDGLNVGQLGQVRLAYTVTTGPSASSGGQPAVYNDFRVILVLGANDAPTVANDVALAGESQGTRTFDLIGHATDVDSAPGTLAISGTPSVTITDGEGTVLAVAPSAYSFVNGQFVLDTSAFTFLNQGDVARVQVSYAVTDGQSVSAPATYDVLVFGDYNRISGDGIVTGTAYEDILTGGAGDDTLDALAGDDILIGLEGNDTLNGGDGVDIAVYDAVSGYTLGVTQNADGFVTAFDTVTDANADGYDEGTDTLTGIETLSFDGRILSLADPIQVFDAEGQLTGTYDTIQGAVNAATDGGTVLINGGTYVEQVVVSEFTGLTIRAVAGTTVTIVAPADVVATGEKVSGQLVEAVVTVVDSANVTIQDIHVDGAHVGNTIGALSDFSGVFFENSSGGLIDVDVTGVGAPVVDGAVSGGQIGRAVLIENDSALAFSMTGGSITDFQKNGLVANNATLTVTGVTITGAGEQGNAQNGIVAFGSSGTISGNTITNLGQVGPTVSIATGVLLYTGNHDLAVTGNTIAGASAAGRFAGIDVAFDITGGSITGNTISNADTGVVVEGPVGPQTIVVSGNTVTASDEGVSFSPTNLEAVVAHNVSGSALVDFLMGAAGADQLTGLAGDDTLFANGGDDMVWGNQGNDLMSGGEGADALYGGQGNDVLYGDAGNDYLEGGAGDDDLHGGDGVDTVGYINAAAGVTVSLLQQGSEDAVPVAVPSVVAPVQNTGGAGLDSLYGFENLIGSAHADTLTGDNTANIIIGGGGNDTVMALFGDDTLFGDAGDDTLYGNQGSDVIHGGIGNDTLYGGQGNDTLFGDAGNDILVGGLGDDILAGGAGADIFVQNAQGRDSILDFDQTAGDRIDVRTIAFTGPLSVTEAGDAGHYVVEGDTNGDGVADFHLDIFGATMAPNQDAFIFA